MNRFFVAAGLLFSFAAWADSPLDIVKEVEHRLVPGNYRTVFELTNYRLDGTVSRYQIRFDIRDADHARGVFTSPEREKGREVLRVDDALWTYLPTVGKTLRSADRDSFAGGDFSNADILRVDWTSHYNPGIAKETENQWIIDLTAKTPEAAYARMRLWVDKATRQPMQQYFYDSRGTLLKRCRYGSVQNFGTVTRPAFLLMENVITTQKTELTVLKLETGQSFADTRFAVDNLGK
jgi:outer membrane lipoprotein-sorting protein